MLDMQEFLINTFWKILALIIGLGVPLFVWKKQQSRKELSYEIISRTSLLSVQEEIKGRLKILFDDKRVRDVDMVIIKVLNSGNLPIKPDDYIRPVKFNFGKKALILSAAVIETNPRNLGESINVVTEDVELSPLLLNSGDSITLKILLTQFEEFNVDWRIVGVEKILEVEVIQLPEVVLTTGAIFILVGILLTLFYKLKAGEYKDPVLLVIVGYGMVVWVMYGSHRYRKAFRRKLLRTFSE